MRALNRYAALGVIIAVAALTASMLPRAEFSMYDEGVYYYQAVLLARSQVPYRDYFSPQPPGLLLVGAASYSIGTGVTGVRAVCWLCGLALLLQTYRLARRVDADAAGMAEIGSALVAVTVVFVYQSVQGATNMPAALLEVTACVVLLGTRRRRFELAGLVLAATTLLRLQSLVAVPGILLLVLLSNGRSGFAGRAARFLAGLAIGGAAIHLPPAMLVPNYLNNTVGFHSDRLRTDWNDRRGEIRKLLQEPPAVAGIAASAWLLVRGGPVLRGLAVHGLTTAALVAVVGKSLSVMYFLPVLPLFAASVAAAVPGRAPILGLVLLVAAIVIRGPDVIGLKRVIMAPDAEHAECLAALREEPGKSVLVLDGRIAVLAGKDVPADYYSTDPNALMLTDRARFHQWFNRVLDRADAVLVTGLLVHWMSDADADRLIASGKPLYFDRDETRKAFGTRFRDAGAKP